MATPPEFSLAEAAPALPARVPPRPRRQQLSPIAATDGELLAVFVRSANGKLGDEAAFARLVARHGGMVWGVCRRVLNHPQDAEDAFQATFLILARRARSIRASESVAGWLYRVAYRTAMSAKRRAKKRREEPLDAEPLAAETAFPDLVSRQTAGVLMEELDRLPAKYRTPLVMRYLEGASRRAIADQTDTTIAAVQGRLARGKKLLRSRLVRRGVSLSAAIAVVGLGAGSAEAAPARLVASTTSGATALAAGGSLTASAAVLSLYREGVRAMLMASIGKPAAAAAGVCVVFAALAAPPALLAADGEEATPGLTLSAAVVAESTEVEAKPTKIAQRSESGSATVGERPGRPTFQFTDLNSTKALGDAFADYVETTRRVYAMRAEEEGDADYSQPTVGELLLERDYWSNKRAATEARRELLNLRGQAFDLETPEAVRLAWRIEASQNTAEWNLARGKILELERRLKHAAAEASSGEEAAEPLSISDATPSAPDDSLKRQLLEHQVRLMKKLQELQKIEGDPRFGEGSQAQQKLQAATAQVNAAIGQLLVQEAGVDEALEATKRLLGETPLPELPAGPIAIAQPARPAFVPPKPAAPAQPPPYGLPHGSVYLGALRGTATYRAAPGDLPVEFELRIRRILEQWTSRAQHERSPIRFVLGRVVLEEGDDPKLVAAQSRIKQDGFFLDVVRDRRGEFGLRRHGYAAGDLNLSDYPDTLVIDAGEVRLRKIPANEQRTLKAIVRPGGAKPRVTLRAALGPINNYTNGYEGDAGAPLVKGRVDDEGRLVVEGLSPIEYHVYFQADGYARKHVKVDLREGAGEHDLGEVTLKGVGWTSPAPTPAASATPKSNNRPKQPAPTVPTAGWPYHPAYQYGPDAKMKQGQWNCLHRATELNPNGWATIAEMKIGDHAPIKLPDDERPRPHVRLDEIKDGVARFTIVDPGEDRDGDSLTSAEPGKVREEIIEAVLCADGAPEQDGAYLILLRPASGPEAAPSGPESVPSIEVALRLLYENQPARAVGRYGQENPPMASRTERRPRPRARASTSATTPAPAASGR